MELKVFLAFPSDCTRHLSEEVENTLTRAGMDVLTANAEHDEVLFVKEVKDAIASVDCSVHILGHEHGQQLELNEALSIDMFQFQEAKKRIEENTGEFKMFMWYPPEFLMQEKETKQEQYINEVQTSILKNMVFTNTDSPIRLVDDIRSLMTFDEREKFNIKEAEIFLIFNELDQSEAGDIVDMLADIVDPIEKLNIIQESGIDYSEFCAQQIGVSKLVTVFFKNTADWALPFTQQIWKQVGGASSHTPILLIGTAEPETNVNKHFTAPKVVSLIVDGGLIPLEIKVQYDSVINSIVE